MTDTQHYQERLDAEATELQAALNELGTPHAGKENDYDETPGVIANTEPDENITADRNEEWHTRRAEVATLEVRLQNVMHALRKIDTGTYGICEVSGEPIEAARLDANPAARTCIAHKDTALSTPA